MAGKEKWKEVQKRISLPEEGITQKKGRLIVCICGRENGLEIYERVSFVLISSRDYNLLIMADYLPVIGEIDGFVFFRDETREYRREQLKGYFMHKKNQFSLLLESEGGRQEKGVGQ